MNIPIIAIIFLFVFTLFRICTISKITENFTVDFIQIYPKHGFNNIIVNFVPLYINEHALIHVDFGDGHKYVTTSRDAFEHNYVTGTYNGLINSKIYSELTQKYIDTVQPFQIIVE